MAPLGKTVDGIGLAILSLIAVLETTFATRRSLQSLIYCDQRFLAWSRVRRPGPSAPSIGPRNLGMTRRSMKRRPGIDIAISIFDPVSLRCQPERC